MHCVKRAKYSRPRNARISVFNRNVFAGSPRFWLRHDTLYDFMICTVYEFFSLRRAKTDIVEIASKFSKRSIKIGMEIKLAKLYVKPPNSALRLDPPQLAEGPAKWWDTMADKSLIVGSYKHGYENYEQMRIDHTLSFIASCPPPSYTCQIK